MPQRNPTTIPPTTPSAAVTLGLTPGQSLWLCLPPGSALHTTQGEVSVRFAPRDCELALHTLPQMRLGAGEHLPEGWNTKAAWVQVGNALHCRSEILVIEAPPKAGALAPSTAPAALSLCRPGQNRKEPRFWQGARNAVTAAPKKKALPDGKALDNARPASGLRRTQP